MRETLFVSNSLERKTHRYYFIVLSISLISMVMGGTEWPLIAGGFRYIHMLSPILIFPRFLIVLVEIKGWKQWFVLLSLPIILFTSFMVLNPYEVLDPYFFSISAYNISFKKILKYFLVINATIWIITTLAATVHLLPNISLSRESLDAENMTYTGDLVKRYKFGYNYPTNYAAHLTYICIIWFVLKNRSARYIHYIIFLLGAFHVYYNCYARLDTVCILLFVLIFFLYNKSYAYKFWTLGITKFVIKYYVLFAAILMIYLTYSYYEDPSSELLNLLNLIMSNRLKLGADALESHGISILGQEFIFYFHSDRHGYNFIDSSYLQLLVIYGLFYFAYILYSHVRLCSINLNRNYFYVPLAVSMVAFHSIVFQGLMCFEFNPFCLGLFAIQDVQKLK